MRDTAQVPAVTDKHRAGGATLDASLPDPNQFPHRLGVRVRFAETDANRHVSQVSYLIYFEEARTDFLAANIPGFEWFRPDRTLVLVRQWIDYLSPAHFPDQLDVRSAIVRLGTSSLRMAHLITRTDGGATTAIARGESTMVLVEETGRTSRPWDEPLRSQLQALVRPDLALNL